MELEMFDAFASGVAVLLGNLASLDKSFSLPRDAKGHRIIVQGIHDSIKWVIGERNRVSESHCLGVLDSGGASLLGNLSSLDNPFSLPQDASA